MNPPQAIQPPKYLFELESEAGWFAVSEPEGWQGIKTEINRDSSIHGLLVSTKVTLTFTGSGYRYLKCVFDTMSFCSEVRMRVKEKCSDDDDYKIISYGIISSSEVIFNLNRCTVKCTIEDNSYFTRLKNNADIEFYLDVPISKNQVAIPAATPTTCTLFDPATLLAPAAPIINGGTARTHYSVDEVLKFAVSFLSDGEMDYRSDYFGIGGPEEGLLITNGKHISSEVVLEQTDTSIGKLTLQEILDELFYAHNIGFVIENPFGRPVFVINEDDFFYDDEIIDTFHKASEVTKKVKTDILYQLINIGSEETISDVGFLSFPEPIRFLGFNQENYHLTMKCNGENTLEIVGKWVRSSNVIQYTLMNPDHSRDENIFFIESERVAFNPFVRKAKQWDILGLGATAATPRFYNGGLTNDKIALRFLKNIPASIASFLGSGNDTFSADNTPNTPQSFLDGSNATISQRSCIFNNDFLNGEFDPNNNYGGGTPQGTLIPTPSASRYTVPSAGYYRFRSQVSVVPKSYCAHNYTIVSNTHSGTFVPGETVTDSSTAATGVVLFFDASNHILYICNSTTFQFAGTATGGTSGATIIGNVSHNFTTATSPSSQGFGVRIIMLHFDSANNILETKTGTSSHWGGLYGAMQLQIDTGIIANTGDYLRILVESQAGVFLRVNWDMYQDFFECYTAATGGGIYQTQDQEGIKPINYIFNYVIGNRRFDNIMLNPRKKLAFNIDGVDNISGWIEEINYDRTTSVAQIRLVSTQQIIEGDCVQSIELEEDGSYSLREDSSKALREHV